MRPIARNEAIALERDGFVVSMLKLDGDGVVLYDPKDGHPFRIPGTACNARYIGSKLRAGYTYSPPSPKEVQKPQDEVVSTKVITKSSGKKSKTRR